MLAEINSLKENQILNTSEEELCNYFVEKYKVESPQIDESQIQVDYGDAKIDVSQRFEYDVFDKSRPFYVTGTRVTFYIPFSGDPKLFKLKPSSFNFKPAPGRHKQRRGRDGLRADNLSRHENRECIQIGISEFEKLPELG